MFRPKSDPLSACSYTCRAGSVRYYTRTDTLDSDTDAATTRNDLSRPAVITLNSVMTRCAAMKSKDSDNPSHSSPNGNCAAGEAS